MENKINIAELLKDCPKGMELNCTMYENVEFDYIEQNSELVYPIHCLMKINGGYNALVFTRNGCNDMHPNAKCVIFPKGKTTWEGFAPPCKFKDGDIIFVTNNESNEDFHYKYIAIFKEIKRDKDIYVYGLYSYNEDVFSLYPYLCEITNSTIIKFATKEEKEKLFQAIKENGYTWNEETKTLEKLHKFKVGDKIKYRSGEIVYRIVQITEDSYVLDNLRSIPISIEHMYNLVPNKFDITTLKVFDKVLVRDHNAQEWVASLFSNYNEPKKYKYICVNGSGYAQCIPYEGNEHLLGTKNDCDDFYKTWE